MNKQIRKFSPIDGVFYLIETPSGELIGKAFNLRNARLISAAADLLRELKQAVARVEIENNTGNGILSAWKRDAKLAIVKAEMG